MNWKILIPVLIMAAVFVSGCTGIGGATTLDVSGIVKQIPEIKAFLDDHPNAEISVVLWNTEYIKENTNKISEKCMPAINVNDNYYKAEINEDGETIIAWLTSDASEAVCILRRGSGANPAPVETAEVEIQAPEIEVEEPKEEPKVEEKEEEPEEPKDEGSISAEFQEYGFGMLILKITNNKNKAISTDAGKTIMILKDDEGTSLCSSTSLETDTFDCKKGCDETIATGETGTLVIKIDGCSSISKGKEYDYRLLFGNDGEVSGSFVPK